MNFYKYEVVFVSQYVLDKCIEEVRNVYINIIMIVFDDNQRISSLVIHIHNVNSMKV